MPLSFFFPFGPSSSSTKLRERKLSSFLTRFLLFAITYQLFFFSMQSRQVSRTHSKYIPLIRGYYERRIRQASHKSIPILSSTIPTETRQTKYKWMYALSSRARGYYLAHVSCSFSCCFCSSSSSLSSSSSHGILGDFSSLANISLKCNGQAPPKIHSQNLLKQKKFCYAFAHHSQKDSFPRNISSSTFTTSGGAAWGAASRYSRPLSDPNRIASFGSHMFNSYTSIFSDSFDKPVKINAMCPCYVT